MMSNVKCSMLVGFESEEAARKALWRIMCFLERMDDARSHWLMICTDESRPASQRLVELQEKFPDVFSHLALNIPEEHELDADRSMTFLCGELESPAADPEWSIRQEGSTIKFCGRVWRVANWEPLRKAMTSFGASHADCQSEEDTESLAISGSHQR